MPLRRFGTSGRGLRIMTSKRALISILATACIILGLYLGFFNHPPAAETLAINVHHHDEGAEEAHVKGVPRFRHLHFRAPPAPAKSSAVRALNLSDSALHSTETLNKVNHFRTANNLKPIITEQTPMKFGASRSSTSQEIKEQGLQGEGKQQHQELLEQQGKSASQDQDVKEPKESDSGWNAGEDQPAEDQDIRENNEDFEDLDKNVGRSKEYGPHHIRIFDWDGWVQKNNFVDIGTIWAYCDDSESPPPVGKIMMKKDEEYGSGVKIVIHMNSTFEENIEFGQIGLSVDVGGVHFFSKKYDACAMVTQSEFFRCPIQAGDKYFHIEQHVPAFLPTGEYYVESQLIDQFDRTIVCAQVKMTL